MTQEFVTLRREVVWRVMECLEDNISYDFNGNPYEEGDELMHAAAANLRAALEQPQVEQEPVAEIQVKNGHWIDTPVAKTTDLADGVHKLYTHPQPKHEPLTHQQIDAIAESMPGGLDGFLKGWGWRQFARAIEAAHNIK